MTKKRENNFDLFRIICMIAVVMIHVSATVTTNLKIDGINNMNRNYSNIL